MNEVVKVGMADLNVIESPDRIRTSGLGSCVGLVLYDPIKRIAGLAHIMLPSSDLGKHGEINEAKYADTAIPLLITLMEKKGGEKRQFQAKLAGGAQMFLFKTTNDSMRIGPRNVEACKDVLKSLGIPILAEDTGGNFGRTIELDAVTGVLNIRSVNQGVKDV
jgi:chemotaxis protein CheD